MHLWEAWEINMQKLCEIKVKCQISKVHEHIVLNPGSLKISKLGFSVDYMIHREMFVL